MNSGRPRTSARTTATGSPRTGSARAPPGSPLPRVEGSSSSTAKRPGTTSSPTNRQPQSYNDDEPATGIRSASGRTTNSSRYGTTPETRSTTATPTSEAPGSAPISRASSVADYTKDDGAACEQKADMVAGNAEFSDRGLFHVIEQLASLEGALWGILDGLKNNATHVSFFCREYWGSSASQAQLSLDKLGCNERLKRQVQQACVLESLSLAVTSHLCSGIMENVSVTVRSRLRNLLYYLHENCLVLLDLVCQRWLAENPDRWSDSHKGHCPENLNLDILVRVKRYRRLRRGEHIMALRQHNEMIANVVRQLCRGASTRPKAPLSSRNSPLDRSPSGRNSASPVPTSQGTVLGVVSDVLGSRTPLDRLRVGTIRQRMLNYMRFRVLLNTDDSDPDCPWPREDPYQRYGANAMGNEGPFIWFEPLPPMLPDLELRPKLPPPVIRDTFTLVLDLDETLIHYFEHDGLGNYHVRPGMHDFLKRMNQLGYELVIFTAATQDYADWVIDQIDPTRLVHHRIYRQHALPWGPIFVKDLSCLGRDLDTMLIIDNVQENFMLQPHNGIFILPWYDDPHDTALFSLTPLLDEMITTRMRVPDILEKYRDQIPTWAGFDQYSQMGDNDVGFNDEYQYQGLGPADFVDDPLEPLDMGPGYGQGPGSVPGPGLVAGPIPSSGRGQVRTYDARNESIPYPQQNALQNATAPQPQTQPQHAVATAPAPQAAKPSLGTVAQPYSSAAPMTSSAYPSQARTQASQPQHAVASAARAPARAQNVDSTQPLQMRGYRPAAPGVTGAFQAAPPQNAAAHGRQGLGPQPLSRRR